MNAVLCAVFSVLILHNITEVTSEDEDSPWWPYQCQDPWDYKCGTLCLDQVYRCYCGGDDWSWYDDIEDQRYCCVAPGDNQCTTYDVGNVNCSSGVLLPWSQPCHDNNCAGSPVIKNNNCQYDCLARSDEVKQNETNIDQYEDLQNCTDSDDDLGLKGTITNGDCKSNYRWCTEDISCHSELSRDGLQLQRFCQNSTFWESQDCNYYSDYSWGGTVMYYGERCRGSQQHCYYPAYRNYDYETWREVGYLSECKDKSDQIFDQQSQCNMRASLDIYCDLCYDNRSDSWWKSKRYGGDCETKCGDREKFIAEETDPNKEWPSEQDRNDVLDPHNCQASCLEPGYGCTACENTEYFNCSSSSQCLHPDLVCDGVPQCHDGEDEEVERCKQKGVFRSDAIMKCQSIFHPTVTILAVPCNGVPECHNNADQPWICKYSPLTGLMLQTVSGVLDFFLGN